MPCLNEAETVATCVRKAIGFLASSGISGEVLVADNGSTDGSQRLATDAGARVVPISDKGYGNALMGGIVAARGKYVIMGDADDSYDFTSLMPFVNALRQGADLVMGNLFRGGVAPGAMPPLHKYLGNPVLSFIGRLFFRSKIGDFHCGLRGFIRDSMMALNLQATGMEFASEMVVKATLAGLAGLVFSVLYRHGRGFRQLNYEHSLRLMIRSVTGLVVSCQVVLGTFFLSILGIKHTRHPVTAASAPIPDESVNHREQSAAAPRL